MDKLNIIELLKVPIKDLMYDPLMSYSETSSVVANECEIPQPINN